MGRRCFRLLGKAAPLTGFPLRSALFTTPAIHLSRPVGGRWCRRLPRNRRRPKTRGTRLVSAVVSHGWEAPDDDTIATFARDASKGCGAPRRENERLKVKSGGAATGDD